MKYKIVAILGCTLLFAGYAHADRTTATFPDQSRPGLLKITNGNGDVTVTGYNGKEVIIETDGAKFAEPDENNERARGLRRLAGAGMSVITDKEANVVGVSRSLNDNVNLTIQVPVNTSVYIGGGIMSGNIKITGVSGQIEVKTLDGDITLDHISGSVAVNTLDGEIIAVIDKVDADKPLSFSTLDGDIDVALPPSIKASVKLSTMDGGIYTDFDIQRDATGSAKEQEKKLKEMQQTQREAERKASQDAARQTGDSKNGINIQIPGLDILMSPDINISFPGIPQSAYYGTINGGGQYIQISTMDGDVYFRKRQ